MYFVLYCLDKPNCLELRKATRDAHLAYVRDGGNVCIGGPLHDEAGDMIGSMLVIEADNLNAARSWSDNDPYAKAGVFETVDVRPWSWVVGKPDVG